MRSIGFCIGMAQMHYDRLVSNAAVMKTVRNLNPDTAQSIREILQRPNLDFARTSSENWTADLTKIFQPYYYMYYTSSEPSFLPE